MSFTVRFWSFSKRYNSTKQPVTANATNFDCIVKDGSAIINPKIVLDLGRTTDPSQYNYCMIPAFNRYYWVREWSFDRGLWTATLEVDVLATYKTEIGASNLYILRAAAAYNGNIVDNLYPCKTGCDFTSQTLTYPYTSGCYVIGCISKYAAYGSITYYVVDSQNMKNLITALMTDVITAANGFSVSDASYALQQSIVDPIQYIKSVTWIPFDASDITTIPFPGGLQLYNWTFSNVTCTAVVYTRVEKSYTFNITKHPDTAARGNYVNASPYTLMTLNFPPFGTIDLDTSNLANATTLDINLDVDVLTGQGNLRVMANGVLMHELKTQVGVPVQITQITNDVLGAASSLAGGVSGAISGALLGGPAGIAGAVGSAINGIGNAIQSIMPKANTIGGGGNYSVLRYPPRLDYQFFRPVDDDLTQNGRPLCEKRVINTLSGYMLIQDGDVSIAGTRTEAEQIRAYLESGFYYE